MSNSAGVKAFFAQLGSGRSDSFAVRLQNAETAITAVGVQASARNRTFVQPNMPVEGSEEVGDLLINDMWVDTDDNNKLYSFTSEGWLPTSDGRFGVLNRVFVQIAEPVADPQFPFNVGDLWFDSDDGFKQRAWDGSSWVLVADTRIEATATALTALESEVSVIDGQVTAQASQITSLEASVGTKNRVFVQPSAPAGGPFAVGDLWIDTDDGNRTYVWNGTSWADRSDARFGLRNRIFSQTTPPVNDGTLIVNDLWIDTDDGNKLYQWNGSSWVNISDGRIDANTASINSEAIARANQDSALASQINTVSTTVDGNTATISSQQTSINGLEARAFLKLDVNGKVVGYEINNDGVTNSFTVLADNFNIVSTSGVEIFSAAQVTNSSGSVVTGGRISGVAEVVVDQFTSGEGRVTFGDSLNPHFQLAGISNNFWSTASLRLGGGAGGAPHEFLGATTLGGTTTLSSLNSAGDPTTTLKLTSSGATINNNTLWHSGNFATNHANGNVPTWNGTTWVAQAITIPLISIQQSGAVTANVPTWNGIAWEAQAPAGSGLTFTPVQQGGGTLQGTNKVFIGWGTDGSGLRVMVDGTDLGPIARLDGSLNGAQFTGTLDATAGFRRGNANSPFNLTSQPRVFVQSADPGAAAADGDLWFW